MEYSVDGIANPSDFPLLTFSDMINNSNQRDEEMNETTANSFKPSTVANQMMKDHNRENQPRQAFPLQIHQNAQLQKNFPLTSSEFWPGMLGQDSISGSNNLKGNSAETVGIVSSKFSEKIVKCRYCILYPPLFADAVSRINEKPPNCKTIWVGGLPKNTTVPIIRDIFERFGEFSELMKMRETFCHIRFKHEESADKALAFSGYRLVIGNGNSQSPDDSGLIFVDYSKSRNDIPPLVPKRKADAKIGEKNTKTVSVKCSETEILIALKKVKNNTDFQETLQQIINWINNGECNKQSCHHFYRIFQSAHSRAKRLKERKSNNKTPMNEIKLEMEEITIQINKIKKLYEAVCQPKVLDYFSKAQRQIIQTWRREILNNDVDILDDEPNSKKIKLVDRLQENRESELQVKNENLRCEIEAAKNEIVVMKSKHEEEIIDISKQLKELTNLLKTSQDELTKMKMDLSNADAKILDLEKRNEDLERKAESASSAEKEQDVTFLNTQLHLIKSESINQIRRLQHELAETKKDRNKDISIHEARLIGLISTFLLPYCLGANLDDVFSYIRKFQISITKSELESLMFRCYTVFKKNIDDSWMLNLYSEAAHVTKNVDPEEFHMETDKSLKHLSQIVDSLYEANASTSKEDFITETNKYIQLLNTGGSTSKVGRGDADFETEVKQFLDELHAPTEMKSNVTTSTTVIFQTNLLNTSIPEKRFSSIRSEEKEKYINNQAIHSCDGSRSRKRKSCDVLDSDSKKAKGKNNVTGNKSDLLKIHERILQDDKHLLDSSLGESELLNIHTLLPNLKTMFSYIFKVKPIIDQLRGDSKLRKHFSVLSDKYFNVFKKIILALPIHMDHISENYEIDFVSKIDENVHSKSIKKNISRARKRSNNLRKQFEDIRNFLINGERMSNNYYNLFENIFKYFERLGSALEAILTSTDRIKTQRSVERTTKNVNQMELISKSDEENRVNENTNKGIADNKILDARDSIQPNVGFSEDLEKSNILQNNDSNTINQDAKNDITDNDTNEQHSMKDQNNIVHTEKSVVGQIKNSNVTNRSTDRDSGKSSSNEYEKTIAQSNIQGQNRNKLQEMCESSVNDGDNKTSDVVVNETSAIIPISSQELLRYSDKFMGTLSELFILYKDFSISIAPLLKNSRKLIELNLLQFMDEHMYHIRLNVGILRCILDRLESDLKSLKVNNEYKQYYELLSDKYFTCFRKFVRFFPIKSLMDNKEQFRLDKKREYSNISDKPEELARILKIHTSRCQNNICDLKYCILKRCQEIPNGYDFIWSNMKYLSLLFHSMYVFSDATDDLRNILIKKKAGVKKLGHAITCDNIPTNTIIDLTEEPPHSLDDSRLSQDIITIQEKQDFNNKHLMEGENQTKDSSIDLNQLNLNTLGNGTIMNINYPRSLKTEGLLLNHKYAEDNLKEMIEAHQIFYHKPNVIQFPPNSHEILDKHFINSMEASNKLLMKIHANIIVIRGLLSDLRNHPEYSQHLFALSEDYFIIFQSFGSILPIKRRFIADMSYKVLDKLYLPIFNPQNHVSTFNKFARKTHRLLSKLRIHIEQIRNIRINEQNIFIKCQDFFRTVFQYFMNLHYSIRSLKLHFNSDENKDHLLDIYAKYKNSFPIFSKIEENKFLVFFQYIPEDAKYVLNDSHQNETDILRNSCEGIPTVIYSNVNTDKQQSLLEKDYKVGCDQKERDKSKMCENSDKSHIEPIIKKKNDNVENQHDTNCDKNSAIPESMLNTKSKIDFLQKLCVIDSEMIISDNIEKDPEFVGGRKERNKSKIRENPDKSHIEPIIKNKDDNVGNHPGMNYQKKNMPFVSDSNMNISDKTQDLVEQNINKSKFREIPNESNVELTTGKNENVGKRPGTNDKEKNIIPGSKLNTRSENDFPKKPCDGMFSNMSSPDKRQSLEDSEFVNDENDTNEFEICKNPSDRCNVALVKEKPQPNFELKSLTKEDMNDGLSDSKISFSKNTKIPNILLENDIPNEAIIDFAKSTQNLRNELQEMFEDNDINSQTILRRQIVLDQTIKCQKLRNELQGLFSDSDFDHSSSKFGNHVGVDDL